MPSAIDNSTLDSSSTFSSTDKIRENHEKYKDLIKENNDEINQQTFLKLLVAEMTNQDPLEPTSNTEFISQLAQFSSMQYMQDASKYSLANYASSLIGKTVSVTEVNSKDKDKVITETGIVEKVTVDKKSNTYTITVNGKDFDISRISSVSSDSGSSSGGMSNINLGNSIANAAMMIGMEATVQQKGTFEDGSGMVDSGIIQSVKVVDGKIKVIINGLPYDLSSITEVQYASGTNSGDVDKPDDSDKVDGSDKTDDTVTDNTNAAEKEQETVDSADSANKEDTASASSRIIPEMPSEYDAAAEAQSLRDTEDIEDLVDF